IRANGIGRLLDLPFFIGLDHRALDELVAHWGGVRRPAPNGDLAAGYGNIGTQFKAELAADMRRAKGEQVRPTSGRRGAAGSHSASSLDSFGHRFARRAVAIGALNLDRGSHLAVE